MKTQVKSATTYNKDGKAMYCINETIFLSAKQLASKGITHPIMLRKAVIELEYYKKGDVLLNEKPCDKDNTIVKSFSIEVGDRVADIMVKAVVEAGLFSADAPAVIAEEPVAAQAELAV